MKNHSRELQRARLLARCSVIACGLLWWAGSGTAVVQAQTAAPGGDSASKAPTESATPERIALEKAFADKLTGAVLQGSFSIDGKDGQKPERYEISSAKKVIGNDWLITARIKYGDKDVQVPMLLKVYWADDTPMISLTNLTIPGLGTFSSRVIFSGDRYAGTWQHDAVGGHLWGTIEKAKPATP